MYLTKNVRKDLDFINGMKAEVLDYIRSTKAVRVRTETGFVFDVWRWTDADRGNVSYYPIRPGYCSTVLKFQGAELPHVTVYLDSGYLDDNGRYRGAIPAAAYTGIGRVKKSTDFLITSRLPLTPDHFTPARG